MKLSTHVLQGQLSYFSNDDQQISVSENEHYRWLAFDDVIQSVMHKRQPAKLTLPHQYAILLPLLFFQPLHIVELGLGGGNIDRFIQALDANISITSVELSKTVIDCFQRYFNPQSHHGIIVNTSALQWLASNSADEHNDVDWLICDVYQHHNESFQDKVQLLSALVDNLNPHACLTINLPDSDDQEINLCLTILQQLQNSHHVVYFHIPNYLNIVVQLIPHHWCHQRPRKRHKDCYLPVAIYKRWQKFWSQHHSVNDLE